MPAWAAKFTHVAAELTSRMLKQDEQISKGNAAAGFTKQKVDEMKVDAHNMRGRIANLEQQIANTEGSVAAAQERASKWKRRAHKLHRQNVVWETRMNVLAETRGISMSDGAPSDSSCSGLGVEASEAESELE